MTIRTEPLRRRGNDMDLPAGKTCNDCWHFRRCNLMFGHVAEDNSCDWSPSRFIDKQPEPASKEDPDGQPL